MIVTIESVTSLTYYTQQSHIVRMVTIMISDNILWAVIQSAFGAIAAKVVQPYLSGY